MKMISKPPRLRYSVIIVFFTTWVAVNGQSTILGRPISPMDFGKPIDLFDNQERLRELYSCVSQKSKDNAWLVVCDRDSNPTYERPGIKYKQTKIINFKESFFVTEEQGEWIRIAKGRANGLQLGNAEDYGWVEKNKMLIWNNCLVHEQTGIHEMALLILNMDDIGTLIKLDTKKFAPFHTGPYSIKTSDNITIHNYYFVYKKENDRFLLGKAQMTNTYNVYLTIIGWVPAKYCVGFNSRIFWEPNINPTAFMERKNNQRFRVIAYKDRQSARLQAQTGIITTDQIIYDQDPAKGSVAISGSNPFRYPGRMLRYPVLSTIESYSDFFRTGVIGEISIKETNNGIEAFSDYGWERILENYKVNSNKFNNYDLLFVIEGSDQMNKFKDNIIEGIRNAVTEIQDAKNMRIGAVIYHRSDSVSTGHSCSVKTMLPANRIEDLINFIKKEPFYTPTHKNVFSGIYNGLNTGLETCGLIDSNINIVFLIGNTAELRPENIQQMSNKKKNSPVPKISDDIIDNLYHLDAHLYVMQCENNGDKACTDFVRLTEKLVLENTKMQYNNYSELRNLYPGIPISEPYIDDLSPSSQIDLTKNAFPGTLHKPIGKNSLTPVQIVEFLKTDVHKSVDFMRQINDALDSVIEKSSNIEYSHWASFSPGILPVLNDLINNSSISREEPQYINGYKLPLYAEVYVPLHIKGAKYPTYSFILFMTSYDLSEYIGFLELFINKAGDGDYYNKRRNLLEAMSKVVRRYSGNANLPKEEVEKLSFNQFIRLIHGVKDAEFILVDPEQNFMLGDIMIENKMSNEQLDNFLNRIVEKSEKLKKIYRQGKLYEFAYNTGEEIYFWIPIEDSF